MKKLFFLTVITSVFFLTSCDNDKEGELSEKAEKNLEVNRAIMKAYEAGDFSKMGDYIATDAIDHAGENGDVKGLDSIVNEMKRYRSQITDPKTEIIREMADDEYVMTWSKFSGIQSGNKMEMSSIDVSKFIDGKAVEHWIFVNPAEMMKMMMGSPQPAIPTTEAKKIRL